MKNYKIKIAILGIGYVGLPLLVSLNKYFDCIGFDIDKSKIKNLKKYNDKSNSISKSKLKNIKFTSKIEDIKNYNIFIVTVPTPVNKKNYPDLSNLRDACRKVAKVIKKNDMVIFESTYAPFTTKNVCMKIIKKESKIDSNSILYGYSPERVNPGDKSKNLNKITKIISSETSTGINIMRTIYSKICANVYSVDKIEIAESAKIIENIQRDINIAYFNNLTQIFSKLKLDSSKIFKAAATKWNFIKMEAGLVGGHCIPVDPYIQKIFGRFYRQYKKGHIFLFNFAKIFSHLL